MHSTTNKIPLIYTTVALCAQLSCPYTRQSSGDKLKARTAGAGQGLGS
jgi:hypothetical protein